MFTLFQRIATKSNDLLTVSSWLKQQQQRRSCWNISQLKLPSSMMWEHWKTKRVKRYSHFMSQRSSTVSEVKLKLQIHPWTMSCTTSRLHLTFMPDHYSTQTALLECLDGWNIEKRNHKEHQPCRRFTVLICCGQTEYLCRLLRATK